MASRTRSTSPARCAGAPRRSRRTSTSRTSRTSCHASRSCRPTLRAWHGGARYSSRRSRATRRTRGRTSACPKTRRSSWARTSRCERAPRPLRLGGELAAGGVDVPAAGEAHRRAEAVVLEDGAERVDRRAARALVHPRRVVRDEVHLEDLRIEDLRERERLLVSVVDPGEHHVLDED